MTLAAPDPLAAAAFLALAMSTAGIAHVAWMRSALARTLAQPIDLGRTWRGKRIFGPNKTVRGFVVMPAAAAVAFWAWWAARRQLPAWLGQGIWQLGAAHYLALGFSCGLALMLAELANSFVKRRLDIAPGWPAESPRLRAVFFVADRCDSVLGVLVAASLLVPVPVATWIAILVVGPCLHAGFSTAQHLLGAKARAL